PEPSDRLNPVTLPSSGLEALLRPAALRAGSARLLLLLLVGCAPGGDPDHLAIAGPFEFTSQEPARDGYVYTRLQVAETLIDVAEDGRLIPGLAEAWSVSDDELRWQFTLREGVLFHDGTALTAEAAANALLQARKRSILLRKAPVVTITARDARVLQIDLERPFALLPASLTHYSTLIAAPASYREDGYMEQLFGTGPYRIVVVEPPHRIVVERVAAEVGEIARISYLTGHRAESRTLQILAGQTDLVYTLDPASLDPLRKSPEIEVHERIIPRTLQLKVNAGHPFLSDVRARRALSLALDRQGLAAHVVRAPGSEAAQVMPPLFESWHLPDVAVPVQDLDRARSLLQSLGWRPDAEGQLVRSGQRFELELMTYADRPELVVLSTAIQAQLAELGITVSVAVENSGSIPLGHASGTLDLALVARNYGTLGDPLGTILADFGGDGGGDWGAMNWDNAEILPALEALQRLQDPEEKQRLVTQVATVLERELPVIPVLYYVQQTAVAERVESFSFDPFERNYRVASMRLTSP
ncbi:MAG: ABC transporter substrate-binding protein, partial [Acidobacteriota bacterium]